MTEPVAALNQLGRWLLSNLGRLSIELAILAGVVLAVLALLKVRSPRLRHLFWGLVLAKPVVTFLVASPLSLYWFLRPPTPEPPPAAAPVSVMREVGRAYRRPPMAVRMRRPERAVAAAQSPPAIAWWRSLDNHGGAAFVWLVVAAALGLRLVVGFAFVSFLRHTARLQREGPLAKLADEAAAALGMRRRVPVALSAAAHGPVLSGVLRPMVLLPDEVAESFPHEQLRMIMAHELAHARRLDNLVLLVQRLAELLLFFHPVVWLCGRAMRREAEAACDDAVLTAYGGSAPDASATYAQSLTRIAEMHSGFTQKLLVNTFAAAESHLSQRVRRILTGRVGKMTLGVTAAWVAALIVLGCLGLPTASERDAKKAAKESAAAQQKEDKAMSLTVGQLRYGFRHDPMKWVAEDESIQGALVRAHVFGTPQAGDEDVIEKRVSEILKDQREDGSFGDTSKETGAELLDLLELGFDRNRPEVKRAADAILRQTRAGRNADEWYEKDGVLSIYALHSLCLAGRTDEPEVGFSLRWLADHPEEYIGFDKGCPWTPAVFLKALWAGREVEDVDAPLERGLKWFHDSMNEAGCLGWKDPWGATDCAGYADHTLGRAVVLRQLPLILRAQRPDGGWGGNSLKVFRALRRYGLLESLRNAPALPADWRVVRSIPTPPGDFFTMAWDGARLWLYDRQGGEAVAVSPEDGAVVKRLQVSVPNARGIGWCDEGLLVTRQDPEQEEWQANDEARRLVVLDPDTGQVKREVVLRGMNSVWGAAQVGGELVVADGFLNAVGIFDLADPGKHRVRDLAGPGPIALAAEGGGVWHSDWLVHQVIFRSDLNGRLLDWGTVPFGSGGGDWGDQMATQGLAFDGERLWLLDAAGGRVCAVERVRRTAADDIEHALRAEGVTVEAKQHGAPGVGPGEVVPPDLAELAAQSFSDSLEGQVDYLAGVPMAHVQALNHAGFEMDYAAFTALSGWAFSFGYQYGDISPGFMAVKGAPGSRGPYGAFQIAEWFGLGYDDCPTAEKDNLWDFVRKHVGEGRPVLSEHRDGGLIIGYREREGRRELRFTGNVGGPWLDIDDMQPYEVCVLLPGGEALPAPKLYTDGLRRAVHYGAMTEWDGVPQGIAALEAYAADVAGPTKDFADCGEYFCWAAFERLEARKCAAVWLERAADVLGGDARQPLLAAAGHYSEAHRHYEEYRRAVGGGDESAPEGLERRPETIAKAVPILRAAIAEEKAGLAQMQAALAEMGIAGQAISAKAGAGSRVQPKEENVLIEGVPTLSWGESSDTTFAGAMEAALAVTDHPYSATQIMGYSGLAFRVRWAGDGEDGEKGWCPSIPVGEFPEEQAAVASATGWRFDTIDEMANEQDPRMGRYADQLAAAIDSGMPVVGYPDKDDLNVAVAYGYEGSGAGRKFLWRTYWSGDEGKAVPVADTGPWVMIPVEFGGAPDARRRLIETLSIAVRNWRRDGSESGSGYRYAWGERALEAWRDDLRRAEEFTEEQRKGLFFANWWNFEAWQDARARASAFLKDEADHVGPEAREALLQAAELYAQEAALLQAQLGRQEAFLGPWSGKGFADWTPAVREREQQILAEALGLEREAIVEIEKALGAAGIQVPGSAAAAGTSGPSGGLASVATRANVQREGGKVWIEDVPPSGGDGNGYVRGLEVMLAHAGTPVSYERLMGLSGMAFITQADAEHRWEGTVDVGWWPLDLWGLELRRDFLARAIGWEVQEVGWQTLTEEEAAAARSNVPRYYREEVEPHVKRSIDAGRPVLAISDFGFVIAGYDDASDQPPVLGRCARETEAKLGRPESWPHGLLTIGARTKAMDRDAADVAALQYAVGLAYDRVGPDDPRWRDRRFTGQKAFAAWAALLRDLAEPVEDRHHANMQWQLRVNRTAAAAYLRGVAGRRGGEAAEALRAAAASYESVLDQLSRIDCEGLAARPGARSRLADQVDLIAATELKAAADVRRALRALGVAVPEPLAQNSGGRTAEAPERRVLEGVPRVAYHTDRWRFTPFCNALDACLQYLGEGEQYDYLMCTSGAAFRMTWAPQAWDGGNSDILGMTEETLEPMRRAFRSAGYEIVPVAKAEPAGWPEDILRDSAERLGGELTDEAGFRRRIIESIDSGRPVIAFGIIGPPEACVISGYDEGGDVLIGWNVFQDDEGAETEPSGYFRVRDWYRKTHALLLIGDRAGKPDPTELDREALKWALQVLRTPRVRNADAGPAAFDSWAADMLNDEYFPEGNIGVLRARLMCHWDSMTVTATRGGGGATAYLLAAAEREPAMAEHLRAAADCLDREDVVHGVAPGEEAQMARLAAPDVRRQVAESILRARDMHVEAADHIEQALLAAGVPSEDIPRPQTVPAGEAEDRGERVVLKGVPKVGFGVIDGNVAMTPFPACLKACLEYMGDDLGFGDGGKYPRDAVYAYLMGTTGAAFRLNWKPGWHGDNVASWLLSNDPSEIFRRGFAAAGYEQIPSGHLPDAEKEGRFRSMVISSIRDRGLPVIAHGVIGPPEEAIIAGYDEGGRVAIGWSFFQDRAIGSPGVEFEPNGYFRKRRWEADTWSMMSIGDKVGTPKRRDAYIDALQWALRVMREPVRYGDRHSGLAAYDAWAEHILRDDEVAAGGGPEDAFIVHCDAADVVAEGRWYASVFLRQAADFLPEAKDELLAAADCCKAEHDLMWKLWGEVGSNVPSEETRREFLKPDVRRRIVPIIRQARDRDAEAARHIENALRALGVEGVEPGAPEVALNAATESEEERDVGTGNGQDGVLLEGAVADFRHIADNVAGHRIELCVRGADENVYPQPYCYLTTLLVQMHAAGWEDVDLDTLAAVSGASAMFGYEPGEFMPKYAFHHRNPNELVARATGYATESVGVANSGEAWEFVRESVDSGRPVAGWHGELMLLAGYQDADAAADRKVFAMKDGNGYFAEWWDWDKFAEWIGEGQHLSRHSARVEARPEKEVALRVMRDLVALSAGVPQSIQDAFPKATFGLAGIDAWAADCADTAKHEDWGMCHPENPQWTVRNSSAIYLERLAEKGIPSAGATEHVRRASQAYRAAYRSWQEAYGLVGYAAPEGSGKVKENRLAAAAAVRRALEHEKVAIAELKEALAAEGDGALPSTAPARS